jgi:hypothetical protein
MGGGRVATGDCLALESGANCDPLNFSVPLITRQLPVILT